MTAALARIYADFAAQCDEAVAADLRMQAAARRERLTNAIREAVEYPALMERHRYFRHCIGGIACSPEEAVTELSCLVRQQKRRLAMRHWSARDFHLPSLVEALTFARWCRRNAQRLSLMQEAA